MKPTINYCVNCVYFDFFYENKMCGNCYMETVTSEPTNYKPLGMKNVKEGEPQ